MTRRVFVATPVAKGKGIEPMTVRCMEEARAELAVLGIEMQWEHWNWGALHTARNMLNAMFMASDCSDIFCVDHDLAWPAGTFTRLLTHPVDLVAVAYPMPSDPENYVLNHIANRPAPIDPESGLMEVCGLGLGLSRMRRSALERMISRYAHRRYQPCYAHDMEAYSLYSFDFDGGADWGEDMGFCRRWRDIGGQIFVDTRVSVRHAGPKVYAGCYGEYLGRQASQLPGATGDLVRAIDGGGDEQAVLRAAQAFLESRAAAALAPHSSAVGAPPSALPPQIADIVAKIDALQAAMPQIAALPEMPE